MSQNPAYQSPKVTYTYTSEVPASNLHVLTLNADGVVAQGTAPTPPPSAASAATSEGEQS